MGTAAPRLSAARLVTTATLIAAVSMFAGSTSVLAQTKPVKIKFESFSVFQQAVSASGTNANCHELLTLPSGPVIIESIDVNTFGDLETYLSIPTESSAGGSFGLSARITVPLDSYPGGFTGHLSTAVVIRDGGVESANPGELTRDEAHPVEICVADDFDGSVIGSTWTISGRVGK